MRSKSVACLVVAVLAAFGLGIAPSRAQSPATLKPDQVALLRQTLAQAPDQGLADKAFAPAGLDGLLNSPDPATRQKGEAELQTAAARYAAAVHRGRLPNGQFDREWGLRPAAFDARAELERAIMDDRLSAWLNGLPPPYAGYKQLVQALKTYRDIAAKGGWKVIPAGKAMKLGVMDRRVPALRERLAAEDPAAAKALAQPTGDPAMFDAPLDQAVKTFQARHGFDADGSVGRETLGALNTPAGARVDQIVANMERWRWLPEVLPPDRVEVNIAAAALTLYRNDAPALSMLAVAGRADDHTPILQSQIHSIVFDPPWNVPQSIADKELWPKERADPSYFQREDFQIVHTAKGDRLKQEAGPKSSLGQLKFDFDNPYGVYLHDTPVRETFNLDSRLVSHGCVRLEKPRDLALDLLQPDPQWTAESIAGAIDEGGTRTVKLAHPIAVLLLYWTAFAGPDGAMNFREDFYGWDKELLGKIAAAHPGNA